MRWAKKLLRTLAPLCERPAIVLDIDGTLLHYDSGGVRTDSPTADLARWCRRRNIQFFFITARDEKHEAMTRKELRECNLEPKALFMMKGDGECALYKERARAHIREQGFSLILSIGDQIWDLTNSELNIPDDCFLLGVLSEDGLFGIKYPSEFQ